MPRRKDSTETERKILEAAAVVFSRKGFRAATIVEICRLAGTNIASVNYHFGDKETLYVQAWRHAFRRTHERHPPHGGVPDDAPAADRLRGWIASAIACVIDPESHDFEILHKDMANSTGLLFDAMRESIEPLRDRLRGIVREMLGDGASREDLDLCEMSIQSQCMNPSIFHMRDERIGLAESVDGPATSRPPRPGPPPLNIDPQSIAEHVIRFSLGGMKAVQKRIESRGRTGRKRRP